MTEPLNAWKQKEIDAKEARRKQNLEKLQKICLKRQKERDTPQINP